MVTITSNLNWTNLKHNRPNQPNHLRQTATSLQAITKRIPPLDGYSSSHFLCLLKRDSGVQPRATMNQAWFLVTHHPEPQWSLFGLKSNNEILSKVYFGLCDPNETGVDMKIDWQPPVGALGLSKYDNLSKTEIDITHRAFSGVTNHIFQNVHFN